MTRARKKEPTLKDAPWARLVMEIRPGTVPVVTAPSQIEALMTQRHLKRLRALGEQARAILELAIESHEQAADPARRKAEAVAKAAKAKEA